VIGEKHAENVYFVEIPMLITAKKVIILNLLKVVTQFNPEHPA